MKHIIFILVLSTLAGLYIFTTNPTNAGILFGFAIGYASGFLDFGYSNYRNGISFIQDLFTLLFHGKIINTDKK
jgi:hypothetical protein